MFSRIKDDESGSSLVEIAFIAPVLMSILLGVVEVGRFANYNVLTASAAKSGVEYGSRTTANSGDTAGIQAAAVADANLPGMVVSTKSFCQCADGSASTCVPTDCGGTHFNQHLTVTVMAPYRPVFNFGLGNTTVTKTVTMTVRP